MTTFLVVATLSGVGACGSSGGTHAAAVGSTLPATTVAVTTTTTAPSTVTTLASATVVGAPRPAGALVVTMARVSYDPDVLTVKSGKLVLFLANQETAPGGGASYFHHNFVLTTDGAGISGVVLAKSKDLEIGESGVFTIDNLAPGKYEYYCTYHVLNSQMSGTLTVTG